MNDHMGHMQYDHGDYPPDLRDYGGYDDGTNQPYSPDGPRDRDRTRDRERRRDRRRREREKDHGDRDYRGRDYGGDRDRNRDRRRPRESRFNDVNDHPRDRRAGSQEEESQVFDYGHGEGFYEEGGYIDHPGHMEEDCGGRGRQRDHRDFDRGERERPGHTWMTETPTHTILLRGLPQHIDEKDIRAELMLFGAPIRDVRLMKRKDTGASRGFAFVEFQNLNDAQRWMDHNQGRLTLLNQHRVYMYYSVPKTGRTGEPPAHDRVQDWQRSDWTCCKCGYHNFKRRDHCFKCNIPREESERAKEGDGHDQVGSNPCNTLIFQGLDALTTEENIVTVLSQMSPIPVKNTKVLRDALTGTSRGFGFVEFGSLAESSKMLEIIHNAPTPFELDGKAIIVSYAKNTFTTIMATMSQQAQAAQSQQGQYDNSQYGQYDATTGYYYDSKTGQYYDPNTGQYYDYAAYYQQQQQAAAGLAQTQTDSTNAAAAVAQAALQAQAAKGLIKPKTPSGKKDATDTADYPKYPTPDVSTYQFDESSGYYYDPTTSLYYDANTQYYYNSTTEQFMYWDGEKQAYLPAPTGADGTLQNPSDKNNDKKEEKKEKKEEKKEKVKVAKKIAKDMEKWAKSQNAQKELMREGFKKISGPSGPSKADRERESASADAGFTILETLKAERALSTDPFKRKEDKHLMPPPSLQPGGDAAGQPGLVASYGGDSEEEDEDDLGNDEERLVDWTKLACLLCKRQFPSKEALQRHQQLSDLHKTNLENFKKTRGPEAGSQAYRDRAKERRAKYGKAPPPLPKKANANAPFSFEQPTKQGLGNDNVGNKLLQKMGWNQGDGLGKAKDGRTVPVKTKRRPTQAGLGAPGSNYERLPGDTYKDVAKRAMFARYSDAE